MMPRTGEDVPLEGHWAAACHHLGRLHLFRGETFPPCAAGDRVEWLLMRGRTGASP